MGGFVGDVFDSVTDVFEDAVDIVKKAADELVEIVSDVGEFVGNVVEGVVDNAIGMVKGAITGDWVEFRDSALGIVTTAVAITAIVIGVLLTPLNPMVGGFLIASGVTMLDAQYNEGQLLARVIHYAAEIESAVAGTNYIETYAAEVQMLITVAATLYAGYYATPVLMDVSGLSAQLAQWKTQLEFLQYYGGMGYGTYQVYGAIQSIKDAQAYWEAKLREAEEYYRNLIAKAEAAKNQWFDMFTNPDLINRIQAGGDLFIMGAAHPLWSQTSVAEPRYALGLIDTSDPEMDKLIGNRYYVQSAGSDGFKIQ